MKLMNKRIISLLLTLAILLSVMPMTAFAVEANDAICDHTDVGGVSTAYDAVQPKAAITDTDALVTDIRQAMVRRQSEIRLRFDGDALTYSELSDLVSQARAHTGVPNEGDYIRANTLRISSSVSTGSDDGGVYTLISIDCNYISDAEMEAEVDTAVEEILNELDLWDASNYEKVKGVYDWITENVQYDYPWDDVEEDTAYYKHTTHAAIIARNAVCQGFASLYYRMMLELGVDCRYISGVSTDITGSEDHAWNIVYLDGKYYNCDPTWDRSLMDHYRYFLCTESNFAGHARDSEYNTAQFHAEYPMAITPYVHNVTASGQINSTLAWILDGDTGTLTVAGTGAIPSYRFSHAPWYNYRESVKTIVVSEGVTEVGERAFYWCTNCTEVILPDSLVAIREYGFNNLRNLQYITLPPNLRIIEFCAFSECVALVSITLPDSVTTVGPCAFSNCYSLTGAVLSNGMTTVPSSMFGGDSALRSVVMPEGITYIDDTAFINCGFSSITIPASVTGIGTAAFSNCTSLTQFIVEAGNPSYKSVDGVLFSADGTHLVCYPAAKSNYYYSVPAGTRYIDYGAFRGQQFMTFVYFPSTLIEIGGYSFSYCTRLYSVTLVSNITTVGSDAFRSCTGLSSVTFSNPNVRLVGYTFANCTSLRNISLPANLREIPNGLFYGCIHLQNITIPATVTKIGSSAFLDCDSLTSVTIPGTVKSIGQQAFDFCNRLETITFEEGVTTLGWICIRNAPKLKSVVIPSSVTQIEQPSNTSSYIFEDCPNVVLSVNCSSYAYRYAVSKGLSYRLFHPLTATVVLPTCTTLGYTVYRCTCGSLNYSDHYTSARGHDYYVTVVEPTCYEEGYTTYTCACGDSYVDDYLDATGHTYKNGICTGCSTEHPNLANYKGKVISVLGDSISTFAGYIPVTDGFNLAHRARYPQSNLLTDVNETWWMQVLTTLDAQLGINDSWAGSRVINTISGNSGDQGEKAAMASLTRIQNLGSNGTPDVILFYGGTNDIGASMPLGTFDPKTAPVEADLTSVKWNTVADAYAVALLRMKHFYPDAQIIAMLPTYTGSYYTNAKLEKYNAVFSAICSHYGVRYLDLRDCGISTADLPDGIHPDANGMDYITAFVLDTLLNDVEMEAGGNVVHSVTHNLNGAESSLGYYRGVTHGKSFVATITGENVTVSVTMGGADITDTAYANGVVTIAAVTGDLVIKAQGRVKPIYEDHLQQLPDSLCCSTNLWTSLVPENTYYTGSAWGNVSGNSVYSITIPVAAGDQIWATSFQKSGTNGGNRNGIRLTWFDESGVLESVSPDNVYTEFSANGYLTAPEGVVAVNVVMWNGNESNEVYILNRDHSYVDGICTNCGEKDPNAGGEAQLGDLNGDTVIDLLDLSEFAVALANSELPEASVADINGDGIVDLLDYSDLAVSLAG